MNKFMLVLICALFLFSGCTNMTDSATAVESNTPQISQHSEATQTPDAKPTVLTPVITPASTIEATPTPTPHIVTQYEKYKKLAVSSNYTIKQLVGINPVPSNIENLSNDPKLFKLTVDLTNKVVKVYKKVGNEYVLYRLMICTIGQSKYSTPQGSFNLTGYHVRFGYFSKYNCYAQYWSQIKGQILFHSILFNRRENSAYRTASYRNLGKAASHGCVRLSVPDAKWVYENCPKGTKVTIGKFKKDKDLVKAVKVPVLK